MLFDLPPSCYQIESDLRKLRKVIRLQSPEYESKMRRDDFIFFSSYALSGLMLPLSPFFFMLLEHYGLQLQHLSPHSITRVVIFITSMRCSWECDCWCACSAASMCCVT
jgi:hypothetical protein